MFSKLKFHRFAVLLKIFLVIFVIIVDNKNNYLTSNDRGQNFCFQSMDFVDNQRSKLLLNISPKIIKGLDDPYCSKDLIGRS